MTGEITGYCDYGKCENIAATKWIARGDVGDPAFVYYCEKHAAEYAEHSDGHSQKP